MSHPTVPMSIRMKATDLLSRRKTFNSFLTTYGRERGRDEFASAYPIRDFKRSQDFVKELYYFAHSQNWDWRELCADLFTDRSFIPAREQQRRMTSCRHCGATVFCDCIDPRPGSVVCESCYQSA